MSFCDFLLVFQQKISWFIIFLGFNCFIMNFHCVFLIWFYVPPTINSHVFFILIFLTSFPEFLWLNQTKDNFLIYFLKILRLRHFTNRLDAGSRDWRPAKLDGWHEHRAHFSSVLPNGYGLRDWRRNGCQRAHFPSAFGSCWFDDAFSTTPWQQPGGRLVRHWLVEHKNPTNYQFFH